MEAGRSKVARFIGAPSTHEVVFTKNATESINLVARSWGAANLGPGDAVVLTPAGAPRQHRPVAAAGR